MQANKDCKRQIDLLFVFVKILKLKNTPSGSAGDGKPKKTYQLRKHEKEPINKFKVNGGIHEKSAA